MLTGARLATGRAAILAATNDHPYARLTTGDGGELTGFLAAGTAAWIGSGPHGRTGYAVGAADPAVRLVTNLLSADAAGVVRSLHLPRLIGAAPCSPVIIAARTDWDFRWARAAPPTQPGEDRVVPLTRADEPAVTNLIDRAFPTSTTRPGHPRVRRWYGIRDAGRLVGCGADCSRGGVGFLSGLTVDARARGRGHGAALTAAISRAMFTVYDTCALGVLIDNDPAARIYERLGFVGVLCRTTVTLA